jgi:MATE family multidrug resistance protein
VTTNQSENHSVIGTEARRLLLLALPLMGAQLAQMGMGVTDVIMAGHYSSVDLAGVMLATSVMWPVTMLLMGVVQAVTPAIAQLNGANKYSEIGEVLRQGLWMAMLGGLIASLVLINIAPFYRFVGVDPNAAAVSIPYLEMTAFGVPALMCFYCLRFLADGTGYTRPALIIAVSALLCKIPLNYILIHGHLGLPELGGVGCGVAQAIVMWAQLILILLVVSRKRFDHTRWMRHFSWPDWQRIKPLLVVGVPIGLTLFAEIGLFSLTTLLIGRFGAEFVASHSIAMNINGLLFMLPFALGMAATIRIGYRVGSREIMPARTTAAIAVVSTVIFSIIGALFILATREYLVAIFSNDPVVRELSYSLLLFVVFFLIFDATQATAIGCLRGYKDTRRPLIIALFSYWVIGLPLGSALGFGWFSDPMGVYGFWIGLSSGLGAAACLLCARLWNVSKNETLIRTLAG